MGELFALTAALVGVLTEPAAAGEDMGLPAAATPFPEFCSKGRILANSPGLITIAAPLGIFCNPVIAARSPLPDRGVLVPDTDAVAGAIATAGVEGVAVAAVVLAFVVLVLVLLLVVAAG